MTQLRALLTEMLAIPSPTYSEQAFVAWLRAQAESLLPGWDLTEHSDCLIISSPTLAAERHKPHLALVGHSDVVPAHFEPRIEQAPEGERLHGSGASDMKGALAAFWLLLTEHGDQLLEHWNLSLIVYSREEQTPLVENGLYDLLGAIPEFFKKIDLAIVGEPTDNTVQLGCVGSIHVKVKVQGLACHSARPWNGENALYKALPFIQAMSALEPVRHEVFGLEFFDVLQITESQSEPGRTSLPGWWQANLNFRFAPVRTEAQAQAELIQKLTSFGLRPEQIDIFDSVPAGDVIETPLFKQLVERLNLPLQAKQAWTDVAQLTAYGIPAFNFGPGLTAQAHKADEYILTSDLEAYYSHLLRLFSLNK